MINIPSVEFEDDDLLKSVQNETGFDMTDMKIINKSIVNNKLKIFYRPIKKMTITTHPTKEKAEAYGNKNYFKYDLRENVNGNWMVISLDK